MGTRLTKKATATFEREDRRRSVSGSMEHFWGIAKYVMHCHKYVECYRCYVNMKYLVTMNELFTRSFMVFIYQKGEKK